MSFRPLIVALVIGTPLSAQTLTGTAKWADSARREIDAATPRGDHARLAGAIALLDRVLTAMPNDPLLTYYKAYAFYRQSAVYLGQNKAKEANEVLEEADRLLEPLESKQPTADVLALHAAIVGQMIGTSGNQMIAGMRLGPKSSTLLDRAVALGPSNPRVWLLKGISSYHAPRMFGGGRDKAEQELRKAIQLYATDRPAPPAPAWGHADAYIWLGQAFEQDDKKDSARVAYQKALELEPEHQWVKFGLLPRVTR
jgi:tetratricopeptide (TPR) repeat protein